MIVNFMLVFNNNLNFTIQYIRTLTNLPRNSKFLLLAIIAALSKKWHANLDKKLLRSSIKIERMTPHCNIKCQTHKNGFYLLESTRKRKIIVIPHDLNSPTCLKQNGMASTPTPIMLFAKVITVPALVPIVISYTQTYCIFVVIRNHVFMSRNMKIPHDQGYVGNHPQNEEKETLVRLH
jgi:hypothetical protein